VCGKGIDDVAVRNLPITSISFQRWFDRLSARFRKIAMSGILLAASQQRTYAFYLSEFKELTRLRVNSPIVSSEGSSATEVETSIVERTISLL
jgi:hypothetical protein